MHNDIVPIPYHRDGMREGSKQHRRSAHLFSLSSNADSISLSSSSSPENSSSLSEGELSSSLLMSE